MADHAGPAADGALRDRAVGRGRERGVEVLGPDVEAVDVVERAVVRLADDRQRPGRVARRRSATDAATSASRTMPTLCVLVMATGDVSMPDSRTHSRPVSSPLPLRRWQPAKTGSWSEAGASRADDRDAGPDRALADDERSVALDEGRVADGHAGDVGDGVVRAGGPQARGVIPRSRARIGRG